MVPLSDIFPIDRGEVIWLESAQSLDHTTGRARELGAAHPGEYVTLNQQT